MSSGKFDGTSRRVPNSGCSTGFTVDSGESDFMANAVKSTEYCLPAAWSSPDTTVPCGSARAGVPITLVGRYVAGSQGPGRFSVISKPVEPSMVNFSGGPS